MPKHTSFITYLISLIEPIRLNARNLGESFIGHEPVDYRGTEPVFTTLFVVLILLYLAAEVRAELRRVDDAVVPEEQLTLRTFFEAFFGYFYNMMRDVMGAKNAKRYFPLVGSLAIFIFVSNTLTLIPGFNPPTSSLNVTIACAGLVFLAFNYYGLKENGWGYLKHLAGPMWFLAPLIFPIEVISTCVRPVTLSVRLMVNMAVDHLIGAIFIGMVALLLPVPLMFLAIIVILVQTLVFCLLTAIYIGLATEHHEEHH